MNAIMPLRQEYRQPSDTLRISACPHPFRPERHDYVVPTGLTIAEIVSVVQADPILREHGVAFVGDTLVPREAWRFVRPKPGCVVSIRLLPAGGGGFMRILASVALTALVVGVAMFVPGGPFIAPLVAIGGGLLLNMLLPPPVPKMAKNYGNESVTYSITGQRNSARPWTKVPFLCGQFKITPSYAALPYREVVGGDIYWRSLFAIAHGPLQMTSLSIGQTDIANFSGVEFEYRRGYWSLPDRGAWNAATGAFPSTSPAFGDTWTCTVSGSVSGRGYIAGQTITFNNIEPATSVHAWDIDQGKPFTLFPSDVYEDSLTAKVLYGSPPTRTSQAAADELGVELIFERGLVHLQNFPAGKRSDSTMTVLIQQSPVGTGNWATVIQTTITGRQTSPLYWGHRWRTTDIGVQDVNKQYDIRVHNVSGDRDEERNFGNFTWYALRTFTMQSPVADPTIAMIALRIKASGQLSGALDEFNLIGNSICRDWDSRTQQWEWRQTSQPASHFRHMLQHPTRQRPAPDSQIDLPKLAYWTEVTSPANRQFNGIFDSKGSLYDALLEVSRVGRAVPSLRELRYSVIIDEPKTVPVRMFTPANSWDYQGEMSHTTTPNAYRIGYVNREKDYATQEVVVYDDNYHAGNAITTELVQWIGIDNQQQAWKEGRFHLAQQRLRREIHKITTDFEHLCCERGDLVALQYDTIAVGLGSIRIVSRVEEGVFITAVNLAAPVTMQFGKSYGIRVRRVVNNEQRTDYYPVVTEEGDQTSLFFSAPPQIIDAPKPGDLAAFGEAGRESLRALVRDIEPRQDLSAVLTLIAEAPGVHVAEFGPIPAYDPVVTIPTRLPAPLILSVASDARVMLVTASRALIDRVVFGLQPISIDGAYTRVTYRLLGTGGSWQTATVQEETVSSVAIIGPEAGESYDFRIQYLHPSYLGSPITAINSYYVIGRTDPPRDLQNMSLAVISGQALLRWDLPTDLDVQVGGWIMFRHTPDLETVALWPNTTTMAQAVVGDQTHVFLPLLEGTYFGRPYDADGRPAVNASHLSTKQASILAFSPVAAVQEDPTFAGAKTNCHVFDNGLLLTDSDFDAIPDIDLAADWDVTGTIAAAGLYKFAAGIDFGVIKKSRVTSRLRVETINQFDFIDSRDSLIDTWDDIDGTAAASVDAAIYGKLTDDDPTATPVWGDFVRIDSLEVTSRAIGELECRMTTNDTTFNIWVLQVRVAAEEVSISPDTIETIIDAGGPGD